MTCVVGVVSAKGVLLAGDSQFSTETTHRWSDEPKAFELSELLAIAYCGSGRLGQILSYHLTDSLEDPPLGMDEHYWAVREFIPYLRDVTHAHGHLHIREDTQVEELGQSAFLLAVRARLFAIEADFSVNEHVQPYEALGSGEDVAIGSLRADLGVDPNDYWPTKAKAERAAVKAIRAASEFTNFVGGKISKVWTVRNTDAEKALARSVLRGD